MTIPAFFHVKDQATTVLAAPMEIGDVTATVTNGEMLGIAPFRAVVEGETIEVGNRTGNALSSIQRHACDTTEARHEAGVAIEIQVIAADIQDLQYAIEEIIAGRGVSTYIHDQATPAASWTITHNLGKYPSVFMVDSAGTVVTGDITYLSDDSLRVDCSGAFAGKAYLN